MRRFIYFDIDTINSYLAQICDGLVESTEIDTQNSRSNNYQSSHNILGNGNLKLDVLGKGLEGKLQYAYEHLKETNNMDLLRDVQTKLLHDNAFDQLMDYLNLNDLIVSDDYKISDFIEIKDDFFILDLDFYKSIFYENGFIENLKQIEGNNIKSSIELEYEQNLNRNQQRNNNIYRSIKKNIDEEIKKNEKQYEDIKKYIDMITSILPYKQLLYMKNYIVTLNEKYMRDDIRMAAFKYGGKIKMVGYITNKIYDENEIVSLNNISAFAGINSSINTVIKLFFNNNSNIFIVHPIALYYE